MIKFWLNSIKMILDQCIDNDKMEVSFLYSTILYNSKEKDVNKDDYIFYMEKFYKLVDYNTFNIYDMKSKCAFYLSKYRYKENYFKKATSNRVLLMLSTFHSL